jgi:hypothetical protein
MNKYLIKITTETLNTKFEIESDKEINHVDDLTKPIVDYLGKSDIKWEENTFHQIHYGHDFFITYEEVKNGSGQHGIVRKETETRV